MLLPSCIPSPNVIALLQSTLSIGVAVTLLVVVILPSIRRVLSGEKIVISKMLGARYGAGRVSATGQQNTGMTTPTRASFLLPPSGPILVGKGDPVPDAIAERVLRVQDALQSATNRWYELFVANLPPPLFSAYLSFLAFEKVVTERH